MTNRLEYVQLSDIASFVNANNPKPFSAREIDWVLQVRVFDILLCWCNECFSRVCSYPCCFIGRLHASSGIRCHLYRTFSHVLYVSGLQKMQSANRVMVAEDKVHLIWRWYNPGKSLKISLQCEQYILIITVWRPEKVFLFALTGILVIYRCTRLRPEFRYQCWRYSLWV